MPALLALLPLLNTALGVFGQFKGTAAQAKATGYVQDALSIVNVVTPLVQQFGNGKEITPDQVRAALAGKDKALADFDAEIAKHGG